MPTYEVVVDFTKTRALRKLIEADDPQQADDKATAEINGPEMIGWADWGATPESAEIVSIEVAPKPRRGD